MGKPYYLQKSLTRDPKEIKARMYVQDPLVAKQHGARVGVQPVELPGEPYLGAGPTTSRVAVVDYNGDLDVVFKPAGVRADGTGFDVGRTSPNRNFQFHQVNVWAAITSALNLLESPKFFGRRIPWAFPGGRLLVLPHAGYMENAFYDRDTGALHFFYFRGPDDTPVYTCLSHDIVTHELGHAVLDGLKPLYNEITSADVSAFHEYFGDALAMTTALALRPVLGAVVGRGSRTLQGRNIVSDIAREFGAALGDADSSLRTAANDVTMRDVRRVFFEHKRSQVLSGVFYDVLQAFYADEHDRQKAKQDRRKPGQRAVAALVNAAGYASRIMLRGLDYCPPAGLSFAEYARSVLRADEAAYPIDARKYRATVREAFRRRGVASRAELAQRHELTNKSFRTYDIEAMAASPTDAYEFVDRNREALQVPRSVNFELVNLYETQKVGANGYYPPREVVLEFAWSEDVQLSGSRFGAFQGSVFPLWCGGTLVFDKNGNVLHYGAALNTTTRSKELLAYIDFLIRDGAISPPSDEQGLGASDTQNYRIAASRRGNRLVLKRNPALRHEESRSVSHGSQA